MPSEPAESGPSADRRRTRAGRAPEPSIDVAALIRTGQIEIKPREIRLEVETRLRIKEADAEHERLLKQVESRHKHRKELLFLSISIGVVVSASLVAGCVLVVPGFAAEDRKRA